ncbi:Ovo transcription factor [Handroanthus impetiginosus]|uniref:Ovo transcription factor n=1 Tax=Handroanthus impetiginosus TaxID=429701 RepID=A0A2G9GNP5_9LAMI|nr:Ovo transcription factor [Handroanthus impetiginosus]
MLQGNIVVDDTMSNLTSAISNEASISSSNNINELGTSMFPQQHPKIQAQSAPKKKRNLPGNPDPEAEVVALSPRTLMATNRFVCEICNKGFQRDQNLQLHRRGHNLPWKLKQRSNKDVIKKKVYVCPEPSCVHHDPSRALGDLTGIKKHFSRKHGEKKWKCEKCSKRYAVQSDWKAHSKICGTREYRCDCGTLFSRRDSFITHRAFCDALAEESSRSMTLQNPLLLSQTPPNHPFHHNHPLIPLKQETQNFNLPPWLSADQQTGVGGPATVNPLFRVEQSIHHENPNPNNISISTNALSSSNSSLMSATALLQKAAQMGVTMSTKMPGQSSDHESILIRPHHHVGAPGFCATSSTTTAGLPSREEMGTGFVHGLSSFGNKVVNVTPDCMELQDINMVGSSNLPCSTSGFDGTSHFPDSFNVMLNTKRNISSFQENNAHLMSLAKDAGSSGGGGGGGGDGLTRDFLGLRAFPAHRDFVNMAGLDQMAASSSSYDHQQPQNQAPWGS